MQVEAKVVVEIVTVCEKLVEERLTVEQNKTIIADESVLESRVALQVQLIGGLCSG